MKFKVESNFELNSDQQKAVNDLSNNFLNKIDSQVLLGVTGSGKTFTMAKVIEKLQKPTLIIAHNKTLAAQLYQEIRDFFPHNAVNYFVSYYDYYQPEAYLPASDTYIAKEATINDEIDKLRLAATTNLLTRNDVIVVASVSCIYNLGSPIEYGKYILEIIKGELISFKSLVTQLINLQYEKNNLEFKRGIFQIKGDVILIWPSYLDHALRIETLDNQIIDIEQIDPLSGELIPLVNNLVKKFVIYPAKHYIINPKQQRKALEEIEKDLVIRLKELKRSNKLVEAYRLEQKVRYDLNQIQEFGFVNGIENYSFYFDGRKTGQPPFTLLEYFQENLNIFKESTRKNSFLTIIDESHMTISQIRGMYFGDASRKKILIDYGFRLPTALENRPLKFDEFLQKATQTLFVSATPNQWEVEQSKQVVVEQLVRPTFLVDPVVEIRPIKHQINDLIKEILLRKNRNERVLVTVLTKKMAEDLADYLNDQRKIENVYNFLKLTEDLILPKVSYLHSDIETLDRADILADLRKGNFDVLIGINLLREGLDLPEVSLVAILDADKEGFLRSRTSLIQTIGRAARHLNGKAVLYADKITNSMKLAIDETQRRRDFQIQYNHDRHLTPSSIIKPIRKQLIRRNDKKNKFEQKKAYLEKIISRKINFEEMSNNLTPFEKKELTKKLRKEMLQAAKEMNFELAAILRDRIKILG